jgi:hypothetical protein
VRCTQGIFVQTNFPFAISGQRNSRFKQAVGGWRKTPMKTILPQPSLSATNIYLSMTWSLISRCGMGFWHSNLLRRQFNH